MKFTKISAFIQQHRRLSLIALLVFALLAGLLAPMAYGFSHLAATSPRGLFGIPLLVQPADPNSSITSGDIQSAGDDFVLPAGWSGADRVSVLIMGLDARDSEGGGASRSDTMILLSVDPVAKTAGMISVPRDLWVVIPGFTPAKINTAYYFGELHKVPGGGPAVAMRTLEQTLGVPIDYYAVVDFDAFVRFVDLIGGVKVDVKEAITVDPIGADTPPKNLKPGVQVLPGAVALAYARERYTSGGDFARSERQQQVILGIRNRILEFNLLPGLIANSPQLYAELSSGIRTNLSLQDAIQLAILATQIQGEDIRRGVIGQDQVVFGRSPDDLSILIPMPDKIHELRDYVFTGNSNLGPLTPGTPQERLAAEAARIAIRNGSGDAGLAERTAQFLGGLGAQVVENSAGSGQSATVLVDRTGNPYTLAYLAEWLGVPSSRILHEFDPDSPVDVEIRLGSDWVGRNSLP